MKIATLEDACYLNMGQSPDSSTYNEVGEGLPFYQGNADFGEKHPHCRVWCSEPTKIAEKEDILISVRAPIGALNEANERCCIGRGLAAIRPKGKINKDFLYYFLLSKKSYLISKGTGSTFKAISKNVLGKLSIPVPAMHEQEKRARILNTLWKVIYTLRVQLAKLDELVKCRFVEITRQHTCSMVSLSSLLNDSFWLMPATPDFVEQTGNIPYITSKNIRNRGIDFDNVKYISNSDFERISQNRAICKNDILVSMIGTLGQIAVVNQDFDFYGQNLYILRLNNEVVNTTYFCEVFCADKTQFDLLSQRNQSTQAYLKANHILGLQIPYVNTDEQNRFASFVHRIDKLRIDVQAALDKAQTLFDSLMQEYFG